MSYLKKWLNYFQDKNIIAELEDISGNRNLNDQSSSYVHCKGNIKFKRDCNFENKYQIHSI